MITIPDLGNARAMVRAWERVMRSKPPEVRESIGRAASDKSRCWRGLLAASLRRNTVLQLFYLAPVPDLGDPTRP